MSLRMDLWSAIESGNEIENGYIDDVHSVDENGK